MLDNISKLCEISIKQINIMKTTEKLELLVRKKQ